MLFVIGGLVTVGTSDMLTQKPCNSTTSTTNSTPTFSAFSYSSVSVHSNDCKNDTTSIFVGDLLIFSSQVIVASQMVLEEKFVTKYNVPALQAVGWEGTFGFTTLSLLLVPFSFIYVGESFGHGPRYVLEDAYDAVYQLAHNPLLLLAYFGKSFFFPHFFGYNLLSSGTVTSIAFFNFAGISVTKELSATTRMVLDSVRTLVIWAVSMLIGWQDFYYLQLIGFCILLAGLLLSGWYIVGSMNIFDTLLRNDAL